MLRLNGRGVLRAVAPPRRRALTHRFVLTTAHDVAGDGERAALLRDLHVLVIGKPFNFNTVFAVVDDVIARSISYQEPP
jgi:hypothetical protein